MIPRSIHDRLRVLKINQLPFDDVVNHSGDAARVRRHVGPPDGDKAGKDEEQIKHEDGESKTRAHEVGHAGLGERVGHVGEEDGQEFGEDGGGGHGDEEAVAAPHRRRQA